MQSLSQQLNGKSTIERAFEIADSGAVDSIKRLTLMLSSEGYSIGVLTGMALLKQLRARISAARQPK